MTSRLNLSRVSSSMKRRKSVSTLPGTRTLTRMSRSANAVAQPRAAASIAPLVAAYTVARGDPSTEPVEEVSTIDGELAVPPGVDGLPVRAIASHGTVIFRVSGGLAARLPLQAAEGASTRRWHWAEAAAARQLARGRRFGGSNRGGDLRSRDA